VIKVIWGREWDNLLAQDHDGALVNKMNTTPDGQFQTYSVESGEYIRNNFFGGDQRLQQMVSNLSDEDLRKLPRGGHDYRKVYAAFKSATEHVGQPTVILAQTIKGWTIEALEGRNATHQMKKLTSDDLKAFRDRLYLPIEDKDLEDAYNPPYFHPGTDSPEYQYMMDRRKQLGGSLPQRKVAPKTLKLPGDDVYKPLSKGNHAPIATTMALVRLFRDLMKDPEIGHRIVPIAPDEYRTFGMDSMFPTAKIYSPHGQNYEAVDRNLLLSWKESSAGQLLHEGISEAGAMGSTIAAGTSYATHGEPMIPFYIFYSMFGFQRTGDSIWAFGDQLGRGFLVGATAGRTTLTGEGLQHADGHSPLLASTNPAVVHYDPGFAYEVGHIVKDGLRRMYGYGLDADKPYGEDVFYYLTVYNEPVAQPAEPENLDVAALLKGMYRFNEYETAEGDDVPRVQLLASGVGLPWVLKAQQILAEQYSVAADIWSVTSWNELRRDAVAAEQHNLLHPEEPEQVPFVTEQLKDTKGPVVAVSDFMRAVQDQISRWVPNDYTSLGTDGWGLADTRAAARRHFQVDAESIVVATLEILAKRGDVKPEVAAEAARKFRIDDPTAVAGVKQEGAGA
jgi:pyruvate dehydrogenase E1 component